MICISIIIWRMHIDVGGMDFRVFCFCGDILYMPLSFHLIIHSLVHEITRMTVEWLSVR